MGEKGGGIKKGCGAYLSELGRQVGCDDVAVLGVWDGLLLRTTSIGEVSGLQQLEELSVELFALWGLEHARGERRLQWVPHLFV